MLKKLKSRKYQEKVEAKAAYEAGRPTQPTYKVDETEDVFQTVETSKPEEAEAGPKGKKKKSKKKAAAKAQVSNWNCDWFFFAIWFILLGIFFSDIMLCGKAIRISRTNFRKYIWKCLIFRIIQNKRCPNFISI